MTKNRIQIKLKTNYMHIISNVYTANRENTSRFEASQKKLPLTITTDKTKAIKRMLSESGPESVLASKGEYSRMRTFVIGTDKRAVLAFSAENKRVDGFIMNNKDQQLIPVQSYDMPKELRDILSSDAFEAFLKDVQARIVQLSNGDCRLIIQQGLKGGVYKVGDLYSSSGDIQKIKNTLKTISVDERPGGTRESRIIIKNESCFPLKLKNEGAKTGYFYTKAADAFLGADHTIAPGAAGGIFYASTNNFMPFGTKGYITLDIETPGRNYVTVCAFGTGCWIDNAARIEIRAGEGAQDELGRIFGHGVDATGRVTDMGDLLADSDRSTGVTTSFFESCRMFKVSCEFESDVHAEFIFTFQNK